jgi:hypothetical protein
MEEPDAVRRRDAHARLLFALATSQHDGAAYEQLWPLIVGTLVRQVQLLRISHSCCGPSQGHHRLTLGGATPRRLLVVCGAQAEAREGADKSDIDEGERIRRKCLLAGLLRFGCMGSAECEPLLDHILAIIVRSPFKPLTPLCPRSPGHNFTHHHLVGLGSSC